MSDCEELFDSCSTRLLALFATCFFCFPLAFGAAFLPFGGLEVFTVFAAFVAFLFSFSMRLSSTVLMLKSLCVASFILSLRVFHELFGSEMEADLRCLIV
ncbi:hypothetical protein HHI36_000396 [Cryptolaemus montrouzieri]|uniref:Transmembrane protein n=1 Tax=Cryptolaemus montrouzieri TaxID=559131 RepID=A0ABD2P4Y3_9CUCU